MTSCIRNVGNDQFPLWIKDSDIYRKRDKFPIESVNFKNLIGKDVGFSELSGLDPARDKGKIIGVIVINWQVAGLEVIVKNGGKFIGPISYFYVSTASQILVDSYTYSWHSMKVKYALRLWDKAHTYLSPDWSGIEMFHWYLTHVESAVIIESAGWYNYPSNVVVLPNKSNEYHGVDWRIICKPRPFSLSDPTLTSTVINCHSVLFNGTWTLTTTITELKGVALIPYIKQFKNVITHYDPWIRSMIWTINVVNLISTHNYSYKSVINDMLYRIQLAENIRGEMMVYQQQITNILRGFNMSSFESRCFLTDYKFPYISVAINAWALPTLTIGKYGHPMYYAGDESRAREEILHDYKAVNRFYGEMTIHTEALDLLNSPNGGRHDPEDKLPYYKYVMMHELIHGIFNNKCNGNSHGRRFQRIATAMGIPKKYQD